MTKLAEFGIKCGNCKERHLTSQEVRSCHDGGDAPKEAPGGTTPKPPASAPQQALIRMATGKQVDFIRGLLGTRAISDEGHQLLATLLNEGGLTFQQAKAIIPQLQPLPWKSRKTGRSIADDGMYRTPEGTIYRVQTKPDSNYRMAKRLEHTQGQKKARYTRGEWTGNGYSEDKMVFRLKAEWRMTEEEAAKFGALYNFCIVCGRTLTHEDSIAAGIGPVCRQSV